jgi:hypothetical protein
MLPTNHGLRLVWYTCSRCLARGRVYNMCRDDVCTAILHLGCDTGVWPGDST